jgi:hypothetical protein
MFDANRFAALVVSAAALGGCGGEGSKSTTQHQLAPGDDGGTPEGDGCDAVPLAPPAPGTGIQVSIDMQLDPGQERQVCKLVLAPEKVNMNWSDGLFTKGSHHGEVIGTTYSGALPTQNLRGETVDASQVADCESNNSDWSITGVIAGGRPVGEDARFGAGSFPKGTLPDDVAFKIDAGEVLELNFHMLNTSTKPVHACYKANLNGIPDDQVKSEAGLMFDYDLFITVPANGTSTATMACPVSSDITMSAAVSHMHRRGVDYTSSLFDGDPTAGGKELQKLYEGKDWEEPAIRQFTPALSLKTGQWIEYSCTYQNPEARNVAQGQQTTDEMCMFIAAYWPRTPQMDFCGGASITQIDAAARFIGTGTMNGAQFADCIKNAASLGGGITGGGPASNDARYATQRCVTESCPAVSAHVMDYLQGKIDITTITCN